MRTSELDTSTLVTRNDTHLAAEDVAAFLDRRLTTAERVGVEEHLADCSQCRGEVAAVRRLVNEKPTRRSFALPVGLAAAAAIVFMLFTVARPDSDRAAARLRTTPSLPADVSERITSVRPADGDSLPAERAVLEWASTGNEPTYRLTVTDATGQLVWTRTTPDTTLTVPRALLEAHRTYFWYVDALRADGRAASTGVRRFTVP